MPPKIELSHCVLDKWYPVQMRRFTSGTADARGRPHFNFIFNLEGNDDSMAGWAATPRLDYDLFLSLRDYYRQEFNKADPSEKNQLCQPTTTWVWAKFGEDPLGRKVVGIQKLETSRFGSGGQ